MDVNRSFADFGAHVVPNFDCLSIGIVVADHVSETIEAFPPPGTLITTRRIALSIGGCSANVAADLARLQVKVGIVGMVGADMSGRSVAEMLATEGVDCQYLQMTHDYPTSETLVVNVRGEDRRFIHCVGANAAFGGSQVTEEMIRSARLLYVGGFGLTALEPREVARIFRIARELGVKTVLDVVLPARLPALEMLTEVLPYTDVFLPNDDEAQRITGLADPVQQAARFRELGAETAVITCGAAGAIVVNGSGVHRYGGYRMEYVDGTGSGDAFVAGYIYGMLTGASPELTATYGSAMGASSVRGMGATASVFRKDELLEFVAKNTLPEFVSY